MHIELEATFLNALRDGINLFLGAGFSVLARDKHGMPLAIGGMLKSELIQEFGMQDKEQLTLSQIATILEATDKDRFYRFLRMRYSVGEFDPRYRFIENMNIGHIFTTNIDDLVSRIYSSSRKHYINDQALNGATFHDRTAIDFIALHGSIVHEKEQLEFGTTDLAASFSTDPDKWHFLTGQLQKTSTLFWGYRLEDAGILQALHPSATHGRDHKPKWIILHEPDPATLAYFKALRFNIIESNTAEMLEYIGGLNPIDELEQDTVRSTHDIFPDEAIPDLGSVPVRPIIDFYSGMAPSWHDIFSGQLHRTEHYSRIIDSVNSDRNTIIIGLPASGKSTLMMQVAAESRFTGHKLVSGPMTLAKAELIVNKLAGERALIFIDDFAASVDAFLALVRQQNIRLVAASRDYSFEQISHLINRTGQNINVFDVTELSALDIQSIFSKVPTTIRTSTFVKPEVAEGVVPSLFEVMTANTVGRNLIDRFRIVLQDLSKKDLLLHDLLVMVCYVHSCGVPVSYDTVSAYLRGDVNGYDQIEELFGRLGAITAEYIGSLAETDQDYYTPRSTIVADAILEHISHHALRRVLQRFWKQVSPIRVCSFYIFQRTAYDARLIARAFVDWEEGMQFFGDLFDKLDTPYVLQQGALYLSHKKRFREAFLWIDQALLLTQKKVWSIRNSHAQILFRANIDLPSDDEMVYKTLQDSMNILEECYKKDRRKPFHAITFAGQSLRFYGVYPGELARQYLYKAERWLKDEQRRAPWNRAVRSLLFDVQRTIAYTAD